MQKNTRIYIRCSMDELNMWKECAFKENLSLSTYARICLNKGPKLSKFVQIDPILLWQIAAIGNNINQIARRVNMSLGVKDRFILEQALENIRHDLERILLATDGKKC